MMKNLTVFFLFWVVLGTMATRGFSQQHAPAQQRVLVVEASCYHPNAYFKIYWLNQPVEKVTLDFRQNPPDWLEQFHLELSRTLNRMAEAGYKLKNVTNHLQPTAQGTIQGQFHSNFYFELP